MIPEHLREPDWIFPRAAFYLALGHRQKQEVPLICATPLQRIALVWDLAAINIHNIITAV
jgi:hypothetical protein